MTYRVLPAQLHVVAEHVKKEVFGKMWGIPAKRVLVETPIARDVLVTTLHARASDHHLLCIDIAERAYVGSLDAFVIHCQNEGLPVKLYVASPPATSAGTFQRDLMKARNNGVGVIVTDGSDPPNVVAEAVPLSVTGLRRVDVAAFPAKLRQPLSTAVATFRSGNPSKGCSALYDEIEALTRRAAERAVRRNAWNGKAPNAKTGPWAKLTQALLSDVDLKAAGLPRLSAALLGRVLGITAHRNDSSHRPNSLHALQRRDSELRTRFETAVDLLRDLAAAVRP
ncbi:MAG: hypothetical protein ACKVZ0_17130 [Gemmatimonadales bacterium]